MANFIVVSPSQTTNGGNSGDLFVFRSGAMSGSTLNGGSGNDTVQMLEGGNAGSASTFSVAGGADLFEIRGAQVSASINAGAGGDSIIVSGNTVISNLNLGAGSDNVALRAGVLTMDGSDSIAAGAGADVVSGLAGANEALSGASFLMGAGADTVTLTAALDSAQFVGGGGADVFTLDATDGGNNLTVRGGAGGDTLTVSGAIGSAMFQGGNGSDNISLRDGEYDSTGGVFGGAGGDIISGNATFTDGAGFTIAGGAGNDTITLDEFGSAGSGAILQGGGGNDVIQIDTEAGSLGVGMTAGRDDNFSAGNGYGTILGGAGADSITFTGAQAGSAGFAGIIGYSALSESTAAGMDVISFAQSAGADDVTEKYLLLDFGGTIATAIGSGAQVGSVSLNNAGFLRSAGDNSSVSDRASAMNTLLVTGEIGTFVDASGSAAYIFVQGGSTDLLVKVDNGALSTAGTVALEANGGGNFKFSIGA
jgi:hypothetical protein